MLRSHNLLNVTRPVDDAQAVQVSSLIFSVPSNYYHVPFKELFNFCKSNSLFGYLRTGATRLVSDLNKIN
jgi:hypothetical protein